MAGRMGGRRAASGGRLLAQRPAGLAQEDVVEARLVERDRGRREARPRRAARRSCGTGGLAAIDVQPDEPVLVVLASRTNGMACDQAPGRASRSPFDADRHHVAGDLPA